VLEVAVPILSVTNLLEALDDYEHVLGIQGRVAVGRVSSSGEFGEATGS